MPYLTGTTQQDMVFYARIIFVSITVAILVYKYVLWVADLQVQTKYTKYKHS